MNLNLHNGYPFPYPQGLTSEEQDDIADKASGVRLNLPGVTHFQWLHTVTVEFATLEAAHEAHKATGWPYWGDKGGLVLEAQVSADDGYDHPAIIANGVAYCGFMLQGEH